MAELSMTKAEREAFLADVHVGVLCVASFDGAGGAGGAPHASPVWYAYEPGGAVVVHVARDGVKADLLRRAGRATLCAQTEVAPYKYVTVEGPVDLEDGHDPNVRHDIAHRYLPPEFADMYLASTEHDVESVTVRLTPDRWHTVDFAKQFA
jgi:PPOX class probable F420-dependent enzyme